MPKVISKLRLTASLADRPALFEAATRRQEKRNRLYRLKAGASRQESANAMAGRGWARDELYGRDRAR